MLTTTNCDAEDTFTRAADHHADTLKTRIEGFPLPHTTSANKSNKISLMLSFGQLESITTRSSPARMPKVDEVFHTPQEMQQKTPSSFTLGTGIRDLGVTIAFLHVTPRQRKRQSLGIRYSCAARRRIFSTSQYVWNLVTTCWKLGLPSRTGSHLVKWNGRHALLPSFLMLLRTAVQRLRLSGSPNTLF